MTNVEIIASTDLIVLLEDEVFADFFNTFLSLPVFGQTPIYIFNDSQWILCPDLPHQLVAKFKGLMTWMEKFRLPHFCKTDSCLHYILCQEFLSFIKSPEGVAMLRWREADQWLLHRCIAGVRGLWRFFAYLQGTAGEDLVDFWISSERILGMDETDAGQRDLYLSLLLMLKTTHLQEGSTVLTLCNVNIKSLLNLSVWHPTQCTTRREVLSHMQKVSLFKLQSYWLPNFYTHCKLCMAKEEKCQALLKEYEERLEQSPPVQPEPPPLKGTIRDGCWTTEPYSSKTAKKRMWRSMAHVSGPLVAEQLRGDGLPLMERPKSSKGRKGRTRPAPNSSPGGRDTLIGPSAPVSPWRQAEGDPDIKDAIGFQSPSLPSPHPEAHWPLKLEDVRERRVCSKLSSSTPIISHPSWPDQKKPSLEYVQWALTSDLCAGRPFWQYLKTRNHEVESLLLDLWQDLENFRHAVMSPKPDGNLLLQHLLGERICQIYLNEGLGFRLPLSPPTIQYLRDLLPSTEALPWILVAQNEICKILSVFYDSFLDQDDEEFLHFVTQSRSFDFRSPKEEEPSGPREYMWLLKRLQGALALSQTMTRMGNFELLMEPHWELAVQDLRKRDSLQMEMESVEKVEDSKKVTFEELAQRDPKLAIQMLSEDYRKYCAARPSLGFLKFETKRIQSSPSRFKLSFIKRGGVILRKPSLRPRYLLEVLYHPIHQKFFKEFLRINGAEAPLLFWLAVEKFSTEPNPRIQKMLISSAIKTYLRNKQRPEKLLQCSAPFIRDIPQARRITMNTMLLAQNLILKSLEEKWFKLYQDLFPMGMEPELELITPQKARRTGTHLKGSRQKKAWWTLISIMKSFCKFQRDMKNSQVRYEFEEFLRRQMFNERENMVIPAACLPYGCRQGLSSASTRGYDSEDVEIVYLRRRLYGTKFVIVNFLVNDFHFFMEIQRFYDLVASRAVLVEAGTGVTENDIVLLRTKGSIIYRLFLQSEIPPRLRVNISDSQKDAVHSSIVEGRLDRSVFHNSFLTLFSIIIHFWKRFCNWKVMNNYGFRKRKMMKEAGVINKVTHHKPNTFGLGEHLFALGRPSDPEVHVA
ncbi:regulator of G-protein signaling protein-like isoform X2 [Tachyglossus aculeatus]|uniref:regulator of G-protein signaling protein-like isoform X2 n=1 Tax=Tachyglossus aculeatus TaxID=9261 RepID=UPI0018F42303|nr:regulator of G-protein signaling protein-like isoform X2 [Tachyglossus aculeatus]